MKRLSYLSLALLLTACHSTNSYAQKNHFALSAKTATVFEKPVATTLLIENTQSTLQYRNSNFIYKLSNNRFIEDFYNQFATSPANQFTQLTLNWFKDNHLFEHVFTTALLLPGDYTLKSILVSINADYSDSTKPQGDIEIEYILLHDNTIVLDKTYGQHIPLTQKSNAALLTAWNTGANNILRELTTDIATIVNPEAIKSLTAPAPTLPLPSGASSEGTSVDENNYLRLEGY